MSHKKRPSAVYRDIENQKKNAVTSLVWLISGVFVMAGLAILLYLSPMFGNHQNADQAEPEQLVEPIATPAHPESEYEFYDVLPKQDFSSTPDETIDFGGTQNTADTVVSEQANDEPVATVLEDDHVTSNGDQANTSTSDQDAQSTFILQIRSYDNAEDADLRRTDVLMAGVDAVVVRRIDPKTQKPLYQVISLPMTSREEVSRAMRLLQSNGIDALMVEQRHK
ncbi:SPOR domain-containing protein [Moraxella nasovis]|uniref:SPOR domain-containing protein n=1 Tax=Moraxella nasovis TaxID=2904121 RepID=UPI001F613E56|nr:SPOR domain-containing protein [Moraxella nasovis]UNU72850.1 SPOR domain-containing protein [Moraxella nasovis]